MRVALVIGNSKYRSATPLTNPANDAADLAKALRGLGFEVVEGRDLDKRGIEDTVGSKFSYTACVYQSLNFQRVRHSTWLMELHFLLFFEQPSKRGMRNDNLIKRGKQLVRKAQHAQCQKGSGIQAD